MITQELYNKIMHALRCGHGGKKTGVDVKFHSWCKAHFQITDNAGADILCSVKSGVRIAITENYFQVRFESLALPFHHLGSRCRFSKTHI